MHLEACRSLAAAATLALLSACGGGGAGGGGPVTPVFSVSANQLTFTATGPGAATPPGQSVSAKVTGTLAGTLYVLVNVTGTAVTNVSQFAISGSTGTATVSVNSPAILGTGTYSSVITVRACANDQSCATGELQGSPQVITVSYTVAGRAIADIVLPHVVVAGLTDQVLIRGSGLTGTTAVAFGATPAQSFSVVGDSLIKATYPATLSPGALAVHLTGSTKPFSGSVAVVGAEAYPATTLSYPQTPARVIATVFDAERQVLYVAASFASNQVVSNSNNQLWRYTYSGGGWSQPTVIGIPYLHDVALPGDGSKLQVLTDTAVLEYDAANPTTPTHTATASFASAEVPGATYLSRFAFGNDGTALVGTGWWGSQAATDAYLYDGVTGTYTDLGGAYQFMYSVDGSGTPLVASADGSVVLAAPAFAGSSGSVVYDPITGLYRPLGDYIVQATDQPPAVDNSGNHVIFTQYNQSPVLNANSSYNAFGYLPGTTAGSTTQVVLVNPQGTRAYVLQSDATLHSIDLTAAPAGSQLSYPEIGAGVAQAIPSTTSPTLRTAVSADGKTLFIAGDAGVAVIPAPQ